MRQERYRSFAELASHEREGVDYQVRAHRRDSTVAILAPHGGKIEPGTSEIAEAIAGERFTFYAFEGIKRGHNADLRLAVLDEPDCIAIAACAAVAVTIDGTPDLKAETVTIGGAAPELAQHLLDALESFSPRIGSSEDAPLRLEISRALRERLKEGTADLDEFALAVRSVLLAHAAIGRSSSGA